MKFALEHYSLAELTRLIKAAKRRLEVLNKRRPAAQVRRDVAHLVAKHGYSIEQLLGTSLPAKAPAKRRKRKLGKVAPKYRNPDNPRDTWTGRGSQPRWLAEKVKRGHHATDFLIPGLAMPTPKKPAAGKKRQLYRAVSD